jgi:hypothetical protein
MHTYTHTHKHRERDTSHTPHLKVHPELEDLLSRWYIPVVNFGRRLQLIAPVSLDLSIGKGCSQTP